MCLKCKHVASLGLRVKLSLDFSGRKKMYVFDVSFRNKIMGLYSKINRIYFFG